MVGKTKGETAGVAIKEFLGRKPNMHFFLVDDSCEHKKANNMNKSVITTISHNK